MIRIALVRGVIFSRMAAGVYWNPSPSWTGTQTGRPFEKTDEIGIAGVVGIGDDHLVALLEKGREEDHHGRRGAGGDEDLIGRNGHAVALSIMIADRLPQFQEAETVGVVGLPLLQGAHAGLLDALRRVEIRLSDLEMDDIFAAPFHLLRGFQDIHDDEGRDLRGSFSDHRLRFFTVPCSMRFTLSGACL